MGKVKQLEIKNRTHFFSNDIINIEQFNSSLLKIDKKIVHRYQYSLHYIHHNLKNIFDCENIYSASPLYLRIGEVDGHIKENYGNK